MPQQDLPIRGPSLSPQESPRYSPEDANNSPDCSPNVNDSCDISPRQRQRFVANVGVKGSSPNQMSEGAKADSAKQAAGGAGEGENTHGNGWADADWQNDGSWGKDGWRDDGWHDSEWQTTNKVPSHDGFGVGAYVRDLRAAGLGHKLKGGSTGNPKDSARKDPKENENLEGKVAKIRKKHLLKQQKGADDGKERKHKGKVEGKSTDVGDNLDEADNSSDTSGDADPDVANPVLDLGARFEKAMAEKSGKNGENGGENYVNPTKTFLFRCLRLKQIINQVYRGDDVNTNSGHVTLNASNRKLKKMKSSVPPPSFHRDFVGVQQRFVADVKESEKKSERFSEDLLCKSQALFRLIETWLHAGYRLEEQMTLGERAEADHGNSKVETNKESDRMMVSLFDPVTVCSVFRCLIDVIKVEKEYYGAANARPGSFISTSIQSSILSRSAFWDDFFRFILSRVFRRGSGANDDDTSGLAEETQSLTQRFAELLREIESATDVPGDVGVGAAGGVADDVLAKFARAFDQESQDAQTQAESDPKQMLNSLNSGSNNRDRRLSLVNYWMQAWTESFLDALLKMKQDQNVRNAQNTPPPAVKSTDRIADWIIRYSSPWVPAVSAVISEADDTNPFDAHRSSSKGSEETNLSKTSSKLLTAETANSRLFWKKAVTTGLTLRASLQLSLNLSLGRPKTALEKRTNDSRNDRNDSHVLTEDSGCNDEDSNELEQRKLALASGLWLRKQRPQAVESTTTKACFTQVVGYCST